MSNESKAAQCKDCRFFAKSAQRSRSGRCMCARSTRDGLFSSYKIRCGHFEARHAGHDHETQEA